MNVKNLAISSALLTAPLLSAADTVKLIINGEIKPITCTLQGNTNRTLQMVAKNLSQFPNINTKVAGDITEDITLRCPNTTAVYLTVADNLKTNSGQNYQFLVGRTTTTHARGFGVALEFLNNTRVIMQFDQQNTIGQKKRLFTSSGDDYTTIHNRVVTVKPYYYRFSSTVSPGLVQAEATLTFDY